MFNKFDKTNMKVAFLTAKLSYCERRQVGAVITRDDRVIANGYNGTSKGSENICEDKYVTCTCCNEKILLTEDVLNVADENGRMITSCSCGAAHVYFTHEDIELKTNDMVIHAEQNALLFASKNGISVNGATMYVTTEPCIECAKFIEASGIKIVIYSDSYKNSAGIELLKKHGVNCYKYEIGKDDERN